ncbi:MAG: polysaccharide deacetylase family protein [Solirubrobacterales bacterium]
MRRWRYLLLVLGLSLLIGPAGPATPSARQKVVALTFDGGPSSYTPKIDRILQRKHVRATFFWVGSRISGWGKVVRRVANQGHEIANHSWFHDDLTTLPAQEVRGQLARTNRRLARLTGERPRVFRPPYGAVNDQVRRIAAGLGMRTVLWDADSLDWTSPGCDAIVARVGRLVRRRSIVLLHDGGGDRRQTVCALPRIIRNLRSRGYRFVTVSKLLRRPTNPPAAPPSPRGYRVSRAAPQ